MATKTHKLYKIAFTVEGSGMFPIDMLRFDRACPMTESESHLITNRDKRTIKLLMFCPTNVGPTEGRWNSFGWEVKSQELIV